MEKQFETNLIGEHVTVDVYEGQAPDWRIPDGPTFSFEAIVRGIYVRGAACLEETSFMVQKCSNGQLLLVQPGLNGNGSKRIEIYVINPYVLHVN